MVVGCHVSCKEFFRFYQSAFLYKIKLKKVVIRVIGSFYYLICRHFLLDHLGYSIVAIHIRVYGEYLFPFRSINVSYSELHNSPKRVVYNRKKNRCCPYGEHNSPNFKWDRYVYIYSEKLHYFIVTPRCGPLAFIYAIKQVWWNLFIAKICYFDSLCCYVICHMVNDIC